MCDMYCGNQSHQGQERFLMNITQAKIARLVAMITNLLFWQFLDPLLLILNFNGFLAPGQNLFLSNTYR